MQSKIINFFGGPGVGKSTLSFGLTYFLKKNGHSCEYVGEYAKDLTYLQRFYELKNQTHVFGEQLRRLMIPYGQVEYIITDSPILLSLFYTNNVLPNDELGLEKLIPRTFLKFHNYNFLVVSDYAFYDPVGRNQTQEESQELGFKIKDYLDSSCYDYKEVNRHTPIEEIWGTIND